MMNIVALIISFAFAGTLLIIASLIRRRYSVLFTRKFIHIGAGIFGAFVIPCLFDDWQFGIIPFAAFVVFNFVSSRYKLIKAMDVEEGDHDTFGTSYFALSITLLFFIFWPMGKPLIASIGISSMTFGDALAAIIGCSYGRHKYKIGCRYKSVEGSAAMLLFTIIPTFIILNYANTLASSRIHALFYSALISILATLLEAFSPSGLDNLTVPLGVSGLLYALVLISPSLLMLIFVAQLAVGIVLLLFFKALTTEAAFHRTRAV
eukprot:TRINITY_DN4135_c0_g1_i1.p1 TRINITY_DN4135_c0_g1~~TRINITY_DN4135_c0_g1_i1.p1  ORF type:complete len:263 (+),score=19.35 TRINITY_DN4135_c0_g1_i1:71-859(+)